MCLFYRSEYFHNCVIIQHLLPEEGDYLPKIALRPIVDALGPARIAALPGFHAWSGADVTGSFAGKQKTWHVKKLLVLVLNYVFL